MVLLNDVYFKNFPAKEQIVFIKAVIDSYYVIKLISSKYINDVHDLITEKITPDQFEARLGETAYQEFERVWFVMKRAYLVHLDTNHKTINLHRLNMEDYLFKGEYFTLRLESFLNAEYYVYGQVNEGGTCSNIGEIQCGTWDKHLFECDYQYTWAGLGTSC